MTGVHFGTKRLDLFQRKVGRTAFRVFPLHGFPWPGALGVQLGTCDHIGGSMQITLRMAADQLAVLGEGNITFNDPSSHNGSCLVALKSVLWELHAGSAMTNGPIRDGEGVCVLCTLL